MNKTNLPLLAFDWDRVILDCDRYMKAVFDALAAKGLPLDVAERLYRDTKDHNGYSDVGLAAGAALELGLDQNEVFEAVDSATRRMADFIYPDARRFLDEAASAGYESVVITAGGEELQTKKVLHSTLREHFKDVHIVPVIGASTHKADILQQLAKTNARVIFFDDRLSNLLPLKDIANITPIWVNRSDADTAAYPENLTITKLSFPLPTK